MDPAAWSGSGAALHATATQQWTALQAALRAAGAAIEIVRPKAGLPDLVFTANAAVVLDRKALLARFHHPQRQGEEPVFAAAFKALARGALVDEIVRLPDGIVLEGAGDCIFDAQRQIFWMGCGLRSDAAAARIIEAEFGLPCVPLALTNPSCFRSATQRSAYLATVIGPFGVSPVRALYARFAALSFSRPFKKRRAFASSPGQ